MARKFMKKKNVIKVDLANYALLMQGVGGIGKTTTMTEMALKEVGDEGYILVTVGREPVAKHISGIYNERCVDWDDLEDLIDEVCENKSDYPDLKIICFDSCDELFRIAEEQVVKEYNRNLEPNKKKVKVVSAAYGGFQKGENRVLELVISTVFRLFDYGITPWFIGHTKQKNQTDVYTGIEFEKITSTLDNKYYIALKDKVSIAMCAYIEREMNDLETVKDAFTKKDKKVGKIASERRVVSFRDEEYAVDVKSHFKEIEPKCDLNTDVIIKTIKDAIKKEVESQSNIKISEKEMEEKIKEERKEIEDTAKDFIKKQEDSLEVKQEKLDKIKANMTNLDMTKLQEILTEHKISDFTNVEVIPMVALDAILELI